MKVCQRLGLKYIGIEINAEYIELSLQRPSVHFPHERKRTKRTRKSVRQMPLFELESDEPPAGNHPSDDCQFGGSFPGGRAYGA